MSRPLDSKAGAGEIERREDAWEAPPPYTQASTSAPVPESYDLVHEEEEWSLDEEQDEVQAGHDEHVPYDKQLGESSVDLASEGRSLPDLPVTPVRLPFPVILPQRRPNDRVRGFIRAYAPDLMRFNIDMPTFMAFLKGLDKAMEMSPWLEVVNLAGEVVGAIPDTVAPGMGLVQLGMKVTVGIYEETQVRKGQNTYISKMNDELFRPRGLYCLILAYDPSSRDTVVQQNISTGQQTDNKPGKYRNHDGTTGPVQFPATAELVFPGLEDEYHGSGVKGYFSKMVAGYQHRSDAKAQKKYLKKNPDGALNSIMEPMVEYTPKELAKVEKRREKYAKKQEKRERKRQKHGGKEERGPRKRLLRKNILYMMITNMPRAEETAEALRLVGRGTE
ncbi:hypothetical protein GGR56DRAFT_650654 [Xylariaceae sp. FL0804]|nr:hypothetical protein GGR56DRAFT_650654 [Xylariaceae sp. FL0804]